MPIGSLRCEAVREVVALQHLRDGEPRGQPHDVRQRELVEPLGLAADLRPLAVEDLEELLEDRLGVRHHLLFGQHRPRLRLAGRVADARRPVADDDDDRVAEVLELPQLAQADRPARA